MPTIDFLWDEWSDNVLQETDENNVVTTYFQRPEKYGEVLYHKAGSRFSFYHFDGNRSTRKLTNVSQSTIKTFIFSGFGELVASSGTGSTPFAYKGAAGYYTNPVTNDIYVRVRMYEPTTGRWLSKDPLGFVDGPNLYGAYFVPTKDDPSGLDFIATSDRQVQAEPIEITVLGRNFRIVFPSFMFHYSVEYWTCPCGDQYGTVGRIVTRAEALFSNCRPKETTELIVALWNARGRFLNHFVLVVQVMIGTIHYPKDLPGNSRLVFNFVDQPDPTETEWAKVIQQAKVYQFGEQTGSEFEHWIESLYHPFQTNSNTFAHHIVTSAGLPWFDLPGAHPQTHAVPSQSHYPGLTFAPNQVPFRR